MEGLVPQGTAAIPHPLEAWCDRPCRRREISAYHLGRLVNRLNWHLQQFWLTLDRGHRLAVSAVLDRLLESVVDLSAPGENALISKLVGFKEDVVASLGSIDAGAAWHEANKACRDWYEADYEFNLGKRLEICEDLIRRLGQSRVDEVRRLLVEEMSDVERHLLSLGEHLDQVPCRADVFRFMDCPLFGRRRHRTRRVSKEFGLRPAPEREQSWLANYNPKPGTLPIQTHLSGIIAKLYEKSQLPGALPTPLFSFPRRPCSQQVLEFTDAIDQLVRDARRTTARRHSSLHSQETGAKWYHDRDATPPRGFHGPLVGQLKELAKWALSGRCDPRALQAYCRDDKKGWVRQMGRTTFEIYFATRPLEVLSKVVDGRVG